MTALRMFAAAVLATVISAPLASADPVGSYNVEGVSPGGTGTYSGTVTVARSAEKYEIIWTIDGREVRGVALGGAFSEGAFMIGPAHRDDLMLAIGFFDGAGYGTATMFLQHTGKYEGFLVRSNGAKAGQEVWTPIE